MSASVVNTQIIAIFSLCIFGGLNTTTFLRCVRWLVFKDEGYALRNHINWPLLALTIFMYLLFITDLFLYMLLPLFYLRQNIYLYGAIATAVVCSSPLLLSATSFNATTQGPISLTVAIIADAILVRPSIPALFHF
ncbi:hypothetical protein AMATHDRAFT_8691 [Amanita thiersii Skay4041]|uniref:G-protein coupled receptors family 1 profile domain-containing protein n=1 Tax=Amanita thiersii Skay4041 TaxID=703135 RepID=A0A2A9NBY7_9AGAR|nr:hypothetical protein AMATHDRAFT_8691 [Amanita thiersii Skay4041]